MTAMATFAVAVTDDALLEATETVIATISNPSNAAVTISTASATANITDNDTATAALSATTQGDEAGPVNIVYTVTLSKTNGSAITFDIDEATGDTATSGSDYTAIAAAAQISVAAGASSGTFAVLVTDDSLLEATETVIATISNPSNAAVTVSTASATATANITDNDAATLSINDITQKETDAGTPVRRRSRLP
jgi:hypothetical protein